MWNDKNIRQNYHSANLVRSILCAVIQPSMLEAGLTIPTFSINREFIYLASDRCAPVHTRSVAIYSLWARRRQIVANLIRHDITCQAIMSWELIQPCWEYLYSYLCVIQSNWKIIYEMVGWCALATGRHWVVADRLWQLRMANSGYFVVFSNLDT